MSITIEQNHSRAFGAAVSLLSQQKGSRLRMAVRQESHTGEVAFYDRIGATAAVKRSSRHADTPRLDIEHSRRRVAVVDYDWADLIDQTDKVRMVYDPTNAYVTAASHAMGRAMDDEIIAAASGTAYGGVEGSEAIAFPSAQRVPVDSSGLTLEKLLAAKEALDAADVDPDEERYIAVTAKQVSNLLSEQEVTSADYNSVKALVEGRIDSFLGFTFIRTQRLGTDGSGDRRVLAWAKSGLLLSTGREPVAKVMERPDKNHATQVFYSMSIGATRMEEEKIVEILCSE